MYETVILGVISSTISDATLEKVRNIRIRLSDHPEVLEDINSRFVESLQAELDSRVAVEIDSATVLDQLAASDKTTTQPPLLRENQDVVEDILGEILQQEIPVERRTEQLEQALRESIKHALNDASREFVKEAHEAGFASKLGLEINIKTLRRVNSLSERVENFTESRPDNDHFLIHNCHGGSFKSDQLRTVNISGPNPPQFVERPELNESPLSDDILITGRKGSGKTRSLLHLVTEKVEKTGIDQVVEFHDSFVEEDVSSLLAKKLTGHTLFVCDDIHRHQTTGGTHPLHLAISRFRTELEEDSCLSVLFSTRSEHFDSVPGHNTGANYLWDKFTRLRLSSLESDEVQRIIESILTEFETDIDGEFIDQLVAKVIRTDSTPHYAVSAVNQLVKEGEFTKAGIEELPTDAEGIWAQQYRTLRHQSEEARRVLLAIKLLRSHIIPPTVATANDVFKNVLEGDQLNYERALTRLLQTHWIELGSPEEDVDGFLLVTHEAQLDAIERIPASVTDSFRDRVLDWDGERFNLDRESAARVQIRVIQAVRHGSNPDFSQIEPHLEQALELAPESVFVQNMCGVVYGEFGREEKGREHFEKGLEIEPDNPHLNYNYGTNLSIRHETDEVLSYYRKANEGWPDNPLILHALGMALVGSGDFEEGLEKYNEAIAEGGEFGELHFGRGDTLILLGKYKESKQDLNRAIELFEDNEQWLRLAKTCQLLSLAHFNTGDFEASIDTAERGLSIIEGIEEGVKMINPVTDDHPSNTSSIKNELVIISTRAVINQEP
jgi:tetratricopeptide (TPR) repeat protein